MLLQTLLENAVKHGVSQSREPGRIAVTVHTTSERLVVDVRNTGPSTRDSGAASAAVPRSGPAPDGEGFGLRSVRERLKGHFGNRASFELFRDDAAGMTVARIEMPREAVRR
jgi:sensor histidine kinase YesM